MKKLLYIPLSIGLLCFSSFCQAADPSPQPETNVSVSTESQGIIDKILSLVTVEKPDKTEVLPTYKHLPTSEAALASYQEAEELLYSALNTNANDERRAKLGKAIELIISVNDKEKDCAAAQFLAAKLYRAYGGLTYAKKYQQMAVDTCARGLAKDLSCRQAHLDLAIMFFAGDYRYDKDYAEYAERAQLHAKEVLQQTETLNKPTARADYQSALASMILGKDKDAKQYLKLALEKGYPANKSYAKVCEDMLDGEFEVYPTKTESVKQSFLAYSFGLVE